MKSSTLTPKIVLPVGVNPRFIQTKEGKEKKIISLLGTQMRFEWGVRQLKGSPNRIRGYTESGCGRSWLKWNVE